ncbi:hypothetical protein [Streptomyces adonidis]|uniref:hypothetical protein n=1 Tax=Streptomyces adonidis TaxID=3231367 RepID=UPI0034DB2548
MALFDDPASPYRREDFDPSTAGHRAELNLNLAVHFEQCKESLADTAGKLETRLKGRGMPEVEGLVGAVARRFAERVDAQYQEAVGRS